MTSLFRLKHRFVRENAAPPRRWRGAFQSRPVAPQLEMLRDQTRRRAGAECALSVAAQPGYFEPKPSTSRPQPPEDLYTSFRLKTCLRPIPDAGGTPALPGEGAAKLYTSFRLKTCLRPIPDAGGTPALPGEGAPKLYTSFRLKTCFHPIPDAGGTPALPGEGAPKLYTSFRLKMCFRPIPDAGGTPALPGGARKLYTSFRLKTWSAPSEAPRRESSCRKVTVFAAGRTRVGRCVFCALDLAGTKRLLRKTTRHRERLRIARRPWRVVRRKGRAAPASTWDAEHTPPYVPAAPRRNTPSPGKNCAPRLVPV